MRKALAVGSFPASEGNFYYYCHAILMTFYCMVEKRKDNYKLQLEFAEMPEVIAKAIKGKTIMVRRKRR